MEYLVDKAIDVLMSLKKGNGISVEVNPDKSGDFFLLVKLINNQEVIYTMQRYYSGAIYYLSDNEKIAFSPYRREGYFLLQEDCNYGM